MSRVRFVAVLAAALLIAASTLATWALLARYTVAIGGGNSRYYSVVRLDRWTGQSWRLDNSGQRWNPIAEPVALK